MYVKNNDIFDLAKASIQYITHRDARTLIEVEDTYFIRNQHYDEVVDFPGETMLVWKQLSLIDYIKNNNN